MGKMVYHHAYVALRRHTAIAVLTSLVVLVALLTVGIATANADVYSYFNGNSCCTNREFSAYFTYELSNAAAASDNQVVCVQEDVWPNYPSSSGSFYDGYKCGSGSTSHSLNGENADDALYWVNGATVYISCAEGY